MNDEVVIVVDPGSSSVKAGYSGDDVPVSVFPSCSSKIKSRLESIEFDDSFGGQEDYFHPIHRGVVTDWDSIEKLWYKIFEELGVKDTETMSIMLAEPLKSSVSDRSKWAEILFETFRAPSICIGNSSALTMFASGRTTGIAVECGAGVTSSVPIFEGLPLRHAAVFADIGGRDITANLRAKLAEHNFDISHFDCKILKEKHCFIGARPLPLSLPLSVSVSVSPGKGGQRHSVSEEVSSFFLPDGEEVPLKKHLFSDCAESLLVNDKDAPSTGIVNQVLESLSLCDESIKRDLMQNVVLSGGTSLLPGLGDRLHAELAPYTDSTWADGNSNNSNSYMSIPHSNSNYNFKYAHTNEFRVYPSTLNREPGYTFQRKFGPWIGGSIIGSLESHSELKISRQEWEEGAESSLWQTKCF